MRLILRCGWRESSARSRIAFLPRVHQPVTHRSSSPVNHFPSPKSIVLVDDEKSYNDLIKQMLVENLDCPVHGFTRPLEAIDALPSLDPGVIVTDYFMPEMNGIEFIQRAAPLVPQAVFLMISGNNLSGEQHRMEKLAALKAFLAKPFGWRKLADEIFRVWPPDSPAPSSRSDASSL
jgi:CheY-like chemotaxis protein